MEAISETHLSKGFLDANSETFSCLILGLTRVLPGDGRGAADREDSRAFTTEMVTDWRPASRLNAAPHDLQPMRREPHEIMALPPQ